MANAIFVFCKGLFSEAIPRLFKKLFAEKPPAVNLTMGDNNSGITYIFNGPVTINQPPRLNLPIERPSSESQKS